MTKSARNIPAAKVQVHPITAQLYYYTPPVQNEPEPEPEPEPTIIQPPEPEEIQQAETEQVSQTKEANPVLSEQENLAEKPLKKPITSPVVPQDKPATNIYQQPLQDVVKGQLHQYQQNKLDSLAAQGAAEYRRQLTSPSLLTKPQDNFITEDEKLMQKITTSVDCSSATNQTMAIVMGIMGGAIKCSEPPPFDSFIQRRLNKTAELPALQN